MFFGVPILSGDLDTHSKVATAARYIYLGFEVVINVNSHFKATSFHQPEEASKQAKAESHLIIL